MFTTVFKAIRSLVGSSFTATISGVIFTFGALVALLLVRDYLPSSPQLDTSMGYLWLHLFPHFSLPSGTPGATSWITVLLIRTKAFFSGGHAGLDIVPLIIQSAWITGSAALLLLLRMSPKTAALTITIFWLGLMPVIVSDLPSFGVMTIVIIFRFTFSWIVARTFSFFFQKVYGNRLLFR